MSKAMVVAYSGGVLIALSLLLAACGDDAVVPDAGGMDAGLDSGRPGRPSDGGFIRGTDGQTTAGDPIPQCDRWDPGACAAGERCHLLIRRRVGEMNFTIYPGCVEDTGARGEGDPCDQWSGGTLYRTAGLEDEVHVDPCGEGLVCTPSRSVRDSFTCNRACESGVMLCASADDYCAGNPAGLEQYCTASDGCNPSDPSACGPGAGCYLWPNDRGDGFVTVCEETTEEPIADGELCQFVNDCNPGSSCWSPARQPPRLWSQATEIRCRAGCLTGESAPTSEDDAGVDDDAGVAGGSCAASEACESFSEAGLELGGLSEQLTESLGQCE